MLEEILSVIVCHLFRGLQGLQSYVPAFHRPAVRWPESEAGFLGLDMNWARARKILARQSKGKQVKAGDFEDLFIDLAVSRRV